MPDLYQPRRLPLPGGAWELGGWGIGRFRLGLSCPTYNNSADYLFREASGTKGAGLLPHSFLDRLSLTWLCCGVH